MKEYQYISIFKILLLYIIAFLPTWLILFRKKTFSSKNIFLKSNCLMIFFEIIIFTLIYIFPNEIVSLFSAQKNIQNYMIYALKILFMASITTVIHYSIPLYISKKSTKKGIYLFLPKILYIPFMIILYLILDTKGILFSIPICDILYNAFLIYTYKKYINKC